MGIVAVKMERERSTCTGKQSWYNEGRARVRLRTNRITSRIGESLLTHF